MLYIIISLFFGWDAVYYYINCGSLRMDYEALGCLPSFMQVTSADKSYLNYKIKPVFEFYFV
jgi:hypothetical protein